MKQQPQPAVVMHDEGGNRLRAEVIIGEKLYRKVGSAAQMRPVPGDEDPFGIGVQYDARADRLVFLEKPYLGIDRYAGTAPVFHNAAEVFR